MILSDAYRIARAGFALMYDCTVDILRINAATMPWGETVRDDEIVGAITVATGIPCRFSQGSVPSVSDSAAITPIAIDYKLFLDPDIEVLAGDILVVTHPERSYPKYYAGKPAVFNTHQEVRISTDAELT